ncbi:MAG: hypothetical protein EKK61_00035 [Rickettsiales bacterium]|nr:MAG: hypothetical protein EKK61_00035 [Rickettsiales bacterium]
MENNKIKNPLTGLSKLEKFIKITFFKLKEQLHGNDDRYVNNENKYYNLVLRTNNSNLTWEQYLKYFSSENIFSRRTENSSLKLSELDCDNSKVN